MTSWAGRTNGLRAQNPTLWKSSLCDESACWNVKTEEHMSKIILWGIAVGLLIAGPAWALFETDKKPIATSKISMEEAIKSATRAVPGKATEADLGKDEERTTWKIEIVDQNNKKQTVYVDAQTGVARMHK